MPALANCDGVRANDPTAAMFPVSVETTVAPNVAAELNGPVAATVATEAIIASVVSASIASEIAVTDGAEAIVAMFGGVAAGGSPARAGVAPAAPAVPP